MMASDSTDTKTPPAQIVDQLLQDRPRFHGREDAGVKDYSIQPNVLRWMCDNIEPGGNSLETGCGYTSVLMASISANHTVISPFPQEHQLIKQWCESNDVDTSHVTFTASTSQEALPTMETRPLRFILIDGDHAFPAPFIDWYYTADQLGVGGFVAVDDTQIPTGRLLCDFLASERERWSLHTVLGKTSIFTRVSDQPVARGVLWIDQPFCQVPRPTFLQRVKRRLLG